MTAYPFLLRSSQVTGLRALYNVGGLGFTTYSTASLPDRLYADLDAAQRPSSILVMEPAIDTTEVAVPLEVLTNGETPLPTSLSAAAKRLEALWLTVEDRHRLLDAGTIEPLAHQASLVDHVLKTPSLRRVLIADEVGLGKTIEAGLLIRELRKASPERPLRVLYLAPASLVDNVAEELTKLGLRPRRWSADASEAMLGPPEPDPLVVASIHRAVVRDGPNHFEMFTKSGPWDVLIVDEAHHLSDWSAQGRDPKQRMRLVRELVENRMTPNARIMLLTATPHQGHDARFRNLLRLLSEKGDDEREARGKIIYRIKDDIRDWDDNPLFPHRDVREPTYVDVHDDYKGWMEQIRHLFREDGENRAFAWRRAQALQWAASSPEAGLAYLVRYAVRQGITDDAVPPLYHAVAALRPYRGGPVDEPVEKLRERLLKQTGGEDEEADPELIDTETLSRVLETGAMLVAGGALSQKLTHIFDWLDESDEQFVIFAQPIETVFALRNRLEERLGATTVSLIVGSQDRSQRQAQIEAFLDGKSNRRVLVSSSAGGEGINLQVARRMIHFDVPWNPMQLEQRVGRIHRYGSSATVNDKEDTIIFSDSWGAGHEFKKMNEAHALSATQGLFLLKPIVR